MVHDKKDIQKFILLLNVLFRVSIISACGYFSRANSDSPRRRIHPRTERSCSKTYINYFPPKSEMRPRSEKFTTSILMYRQIMYHRYGTVMLRVSATCSVLLLRDEKFIFEFYGRNFLTILPAVRFVIRALHRPT